MKKLMLSLALVTGLALTTQAQDTKGANQNPEAQAKKGAEWAVKNLGLNSEQSTRWEAAALQRINNNAPLKEKMKGATTPEERKATRQQLKTNMESFDAAVNTFLTADQKTKWEKLKADKKAKRQAKKADKKGGEEIDLDPEK